MGSRLDRITDWEELARKARYRVERMAGLLKVSRHTLHSHLIQTRGCNPRQWIEELRLRRANELLAQGFSRKEIAFDLGLTPSSLCHFFQRTAGPSSQLSKNSSSQATGPQSGEFQPFELLPEDDLHLTQSFVIWKKRALLE
jgi:AraC-like DNA-binding protein